MAAFASKAQVVLWWQKVFAYRLLVEACEPKESDQKLNLTCLKMSGKQFDNSWLNSGETKRTLKFGNFEATPTNPNGRLAFAKIMILNRRKPEADQFFVHWNRLAKTLKKSDRRIRFELFDC